METLKLRNGAEETKPLITTAYMILSRLMEEDPIAFYELVMKARDSKHKCFGNTGTKLRERALLENGEHMHDSMRNIILSAVEGDGLEMTLRSPVA